MDGRDTPPKSAQTYLKRLQDELDVLSQEFEGKASLASMVGRFFAMDRDKRWERVQKAYDLLTLAQADFDSDDPQQALQQAYERGESDEFVSPVVLDTAGAIGDNDGVIFVNFRADRARQLSDAFVEDGFTGFVRKAVPQLSAFVCMTKYSDSLAQNNKTSIAYLPNSLENTLGEWLAKAGKTQLRIAETEKYAHVTFFFSGGREKPLLGRSGFW